MVTVSTVLGDLTSAQLRLIGELVVGLRRRHRAGDSRPESRLPLGARAATSRRSTAASAPRACRAGGAGTLADVTSCPGAESCKLAVTQSRGLGRLLGDRLQQRPDLVAAVPGLDIKISGCPNGCGQHHIAGLGFQGSLRKVGGQAGAALLRDGRRRRGRRHHDVRQARGDDPGAALRRSARAADWSLPGPNAPPTKRRRVLPARRAVGP